LYQKNKSETLGTLGYEKSTK